MLHATVAVVSAEPARSSNVSKTCGFFQTWSLTNQYNKKTGFCSRTLTLWNLDNYKKDTDKKFHFKTPGFLVNSKFVSTKNMGSGAQSGNISDGNKMCSELWRLQIMVHSTLLEIILQF